MIERLRRSDDGRRWKDADVGEKRDGGMMVENGMIMMMSWFYRDSGGSKEGEVER